MNHAHNHKVIAERVCPDFTWLELGEGAARQHSNGTVVSIHTFNLLETDSDGNHTMKAKANALDVLVWMRNRAVLDDGAVCALHGCLWDTSNGGDTDNPCEAIYKVACQVLWLEVTND